MMQPAAPDTRSILDGDPRKSAHMSPAALRVAPLPPSVSTLTFFTSKHSHSLLSLILSSSIVFSSARDSLETNF